MTLRRIRSLRGRGLDADEGSWAISYGDMVTLLLAFFIVFFSVNPKEEKQMALSRSLLAVLRPLTDGAKAEPAPEPPPQAEYELDRELAARFGATVTKSGTKVIVEFPGRSFFALGQTTLTPTGSDALAQFAERYLPLSGQHLLTIVGFTDASPVRSRRSGARDNLELSVMRAVSAQRYLQAAGIPLARMRLSGYGVGRAPTEAVTDAAPDSVARAAARRIALIIEPEVQP
jgi:chemotaxis protein MotB